MSLSILYFDVFGEARMAVVRLVLVALLAGLAGCAGPGRPQIQQSLRQGLNPIAQASAQAAYPIACPDVIRLHAPDRPEVAGTYAVGPDGRVDLGPVGQPRIEGTTPAEAARRLGELLALPPGRAEVAVAEYHSRHIHLFGQVNGSPRSVPWQGPETVTELLQRIGGLLPGAAVNEVHVVRSQVAEGRRPEVYRIDLHAILTRGDHSTDLRLAPFDEVYVGELKRSSVCKLLPPWLRPTFCHLCGLTGRTDCGCHADR